MIETHKDTHTKEKQRDKEREDTTLRERQREAELLIISTYSYSLFFAGYIYIYIAKKLSSKIKCFSKFSIVRIWSKFKKNHQILIYGSSR